MRSHYNVKCSKFSPLGSITFQCISEHSDLSPLDTSLAVLIGISHSQPITNIIFHFLIIVGSAVSMWLIGFTKYVPSLVLRSHSSLVCWTDRCDHHGRPFDHFRTIWTAFIHDGSFRYHRTALSNDRGFLHEKHVLPKKTHLSQ